MARKILILTEAGDASAEKVCRWLEYYKAAFLRIDTDKQTARFGRLVMKAREVNIYLELDGREYNVEDFPLIWFRRGELMFPSATIKNVAFPDNSWIDHQLNLHLQKEASALMTFVYSEIRRKVKTINNPLRYNINKLECLRCAARLGLVIPETAVVENIKDVKSSLKAQSLITKSIQDILICPVPGAVISQSTEVVDMALPDQYPVRFLPSLFQRQISRVADIRSFFIFEKVVSVAIYPNWGEHSVDFRTTTDFRADRNVTRFKLPVSTEQVLLQVAREMKIESGSADFLLTRDGALVFLEINPVGQLDFISTYGNLYLEREIAQTLIAITHENTRTCSDNGPAEASF